MGNDLGPVLLTGAGGYLGRRVLATITTRGLPCVPTSLSGSVGEPCDLTDGASARALLDRTRPAVVIHCAAAVPKSADAYGDTAAAAASVDMFRGVVDHAHCPIVLASSMTVYGAAAPTPVSEESAAMPAAGYARGKWITEQMLFDRRVADDVALRLPGLFGLPRRAGLLYNAARAFLTTGRFALAGCADDSWAAMSVGDAAEYLVRAATTLSGRAAEAVNVGYEGEFTRESAVAQISSLCGVEWQPVAVHRPFSMRLKRLESRYGLLAVTFGQRLRELVDAIRHDL